MILNAIKSAMMKSEFIYINQQAGNRLPWLDIAKGFAMVAVVFSHEFASVKPLVLLCNSFMLPLFFMCSGFCISPRKYGIVEYFKRKARTLLFPYFVLGMIVSALHISVDGYIVVGHNISDELFSWQTLWFLPVLFFSDIILYSILSKSKDTLLSILGIGILFIMLGIILCCYSFSLPLNLSVIPIAIFFLTVGYGLKRIIIEHKIKYKFIIGCILLILGFSLMFMTKGNLILKLNDILPAIKILFSIFEGAGIIMILSSIVTPPVLQKANLIFGILEYIGKNTMVIFAFHMPIFFYCQSFIRPFIKSQLHYKPIEFILIWGLCLSLIPLFNQYVPNIIGKNKR